MNSQTRESLKQSKFGAGIALVVLVCGVLFSAIAVVYTSFLHRDIEMQLDTGNRLRFQIEVEYTQLSLERGTLASPAEIEKKARERLNMRRPTNQ